MNEMKRIYHRAKARESYLRRKQLYETRCKQSVKVIQFLQARCFVAPGSMIAFKQFCAEFTNWVGPAEAKYWNPTRIQKSLGDKVGRLDDKKMVVNLAFVRMPVSNQLVINGNGQIRLRKKSSAVNYL